MWLLKYKWFFLLISALLIVGAVGVVATRGLNWGVDFVGGSILEVEYRIVRPNVETVRSSTDKLELGLIAIQLAGERGVILRLRTVTDPEHVALLATLPLDG